MRVPKDFAKASVYTALIVLMRIVCRGVIGPHLLFSLVFHMCFLIGGLVPSIIINYNWLLCKLH